MDDVNKQVLKWLRGETEQGKRNTWNDIKVGWCSSASVGELECIQGELQGEVGPAGFV
jgi:hypothetical protein